MQVTVEDVTQSEINNAGSANEVEAKRKNQQRLMEIAHKAVEEGRKKKANDTRHAANDERHKRLPEVWQLD